MGEEIFSVGSARIDLPKVKPIRLGEYGKALEQVWKIFEQVRSVCL